MAIIGTSDGVIAATSAASGTTQRTFARLVRIARTTAATTGDQVILRSSSGTTTIIWEDTYQPAESRLSVSDNIGVDLPNGFFVPTLDNGILYIYK